MNLVNLMVIPFNTTIFLHISLILFSCRAGECVGHLLCVLKQNSVVLAVQSQAEKLVRALWAQPSIEGERVVNTVLNNPAHLIEW